MKVNREVDVTITLSLSEDELKDFIYALHLSKLKFDDHGYPTAQATVEYPIFYADDIYDISASKKRTRNHLTKLLDIHDELQNL
jgi:hypothetical protein